MCERYMRRGGSEDMRNGGVKWRVMHAWRDGECTTECIYLTKKKEKVCLHRRRKRKEKLYGQNILPGNIDLKKGTV